MLQITNAVLKLSGTWQSSEVWIQTCALLVNLNNLKIGEKNNISALQNFSYNTLNPTDAIEAVKYKKCWTINDSCCFFTIFDRTRGWWLADSDFILSRYAEFIFRVGQHTVHFVCCVRNSPASINGLQCKILIK